jgi:excisionase family DNA binding protein
MQQASRIPVAAGIVAATSPTLLTVEEAAAIARCSIKTVRRAYAIGALNAYRRRGSRAVLLDHEDVLAWARGQLVEPTAPARPSIDSTPARPPGRRPIRRVDDEGRVPKLGSQLRFDVSAKGLRKRRSSKSEDRRVGT